MKKIFYRAIERNYNADVEGNAYEVLPEEHECEYSEEWFTDEGFNPVREYVENMLVEPEGFSWSSDEPVSINYGNAGVPDEVLYKNGIPVEAYFVHEV